MANIKVSELPAASSIDSGDLLLVSADPGGTATSKKITFAALISSIAALGALVLSGLNVTGQSTLQDLAFRNATGTNAAIGQVTATTVNAGTGNIGALNVSGQSTLGNTTMTNATGTNVTTTNIAFTNGSGQALTVGGSPVCRADGTNCPGSGVTSLQEAIAEDSIATSTPTFLGGATLSSANVTGTLTSLTTTSTNLFSNSGTIGAFTTNAATIGGGTINATPIGGSTPAAGAFTTLGADGLSSLANVTFTGATGTSGGVTGIWNVGTATGTNGNFNNSQIGSLTGGNANVSGLIFTNATGSAVTTTLATITTLCLLGDSCRTTWPTGGSSGLQPWTDTGSLVRLTTSTHPVQVDSSITVPTLNATNTGISIAASGTIAIAGTATSTFGGPVSTTKAQVDGAFTANGNVLIQKASANIRLCEPGGASCFNFLNDGGAAIRIGGASYTGIRIRDLVVEVFGNLNPLTNNYSNLGTPTVAYSNIYASGTADIFGGKFVNVTSTQATTTFFNVGTTARLPTDTLINSTTVCLSNGTNCPASGGGTITSSTWQYNLTNATIFPTTSTFDVLIGGNTTATAGIVLDGAGTSTFANRVSSTGFIAGIGTQTAPSYGFTGYGGGLWSGGADLRIVTNDLIIRNIADTVTAFRVAGGLATFSVIPTPASHNAYNIGFVNTAWKNIYASGTLFAVGGQFSLVTSTQATTTWLNVGTTARLPADSLINGTTVCLSNGTNCPAGGSQDLQSVTGFGATTTDRIYTQGGIETPSIGINTDDTSVYELNVNGEANFDALVRMSNDLNVVDASENPIFVVRPLAGTPAVGILTEPSELGEALAVLGTVSSSDMIVLNDVVVGGQSVCLENGTNCPAGGTQTLAQVTTLGATTTDPVYLLGGIHTRNINATGTIVGPSMVSATEFVAEVGSAGNPTFTFEDDQDTGLYFSAGELDFAIDGARRGLFTYALGAPAFGIFRTTGSGTSSGSLVPSFSNTSDTDTGLSFLTADTLDVVTGGARRFRVGTVSSTFLTHVFPVSNNTMMLGAPTSSWRGVYASGTSEFASVNMVTATATNATATTFFVSNKLRSATVSSTEFIFPCGDTAASPQIHGTGFTTTGIYCDQFGNLGFSIGGTEVFLIDSANTYFSKSFLPAVDNTIDIGDVNRRFRNFHLTGQMFVTGTNDGIQAFNTTTTNATTTGIVAFTGLAATGVTGDFVCFQTGGKISHQAATCTVSSARFKEKISSLPPEDLLAKVLKLRAVEFDYREDQIPSSGSHSSGFIAEEVARIEPSLVVYTSEFTPEDLAFEQENYPDVILYKDGQTFIPQTVDYSRMSYLTVGAIQAQQDQIVKLQSQMGMEPPKPLNILQRIDVWISNLFKK